MYKTLHHFKFLLVFISQKQLEAQNIFKIFIFKISMLFITIQYNIIILFYCCYYPKYFKYLFGTHSGRIMIFEEFDK